MRSPSPGTHTNADISTAAHAFIQRWQGVTASELATAQSFVIELCELLAVQRPTHEPHYMFERPITFAHGDGSTSAGRVDCYKRGHFVLESKKLNPGREGAGQRVDFNTNNHGLRRRLAARAPAG